MLQIAVSNTKIKSPKALSVSNLTEVGDRCHLGECTLVTFSFLKHCTERSNSRCSDLTDEEYQHILCLKPDRKTSVVSAEAAYSRMALGLSSDGSMFSRSSSDSLDARTTIPPLFYAIQNGELDNLSQILVENPDLVNTLRYGGFTALHTACHVRHPRILTTLLTHGAKLGAIDTLGHTPLHLAVHEGWHEGVAELLRRGASPNILSEPPQSVKEVRVETPLHAAIRHGDLASSTLMMQYHTDLSVRDGDLNAVLRSCLRSQHRYCSLAAVQESVR
ncbi:ankyrin repeat and protein kinase domain-containing protein 1-like [Penaeus japonicus]|uniref:ankyrin repeat and protein kinase domain-containing protein 1-like n=1 Tax=Penaeus japonicus TaxID=27405 RepID=UPI001C70BC57|nr:ankyrin repeat and protein kinase domain-containing protein 1-like [Penaeus japonicus]